MPAVKGAATDLHNGSTPQRSVEGLGQGEGVRSGRGGRRKAPEQNATLRAFTSTSAWERVRAGTAVRAEARRRTKSSVVLRASPAGITGLRMELQRRPPPAAADAAPTRGPVSSQPSPRTLELVDAWS